MKRYRYFLLTAFIIIFDQITKFLVVKNIPLYSSAWSFGGDFFNLIHVRNLGMAFGMGRHVNPILRMMILIGVPLLMLFAIGIYIVRSKEIPNKQRWLFAGILGGGLGNQIDRIFRESGVVDFLDFKFYGLFGLERWPTFNVADSSVVVCAILLMLLIFISEWKGKRS